MDITEYVMSPEEQAGLSPRAQLADADYNHAALNEVFEAIHLADPTTWPLVGADEAGAGGAARAGEPYVHIVEQPHPRALRFRYVCEGRSAGSLPGARSTSDHRTFPTIEVRNYTGRATVLVSCVTADEPYRAHPHNLVGRSEDCSQGVCKVRVDVAPGSCAVVFSNLGVQCVKRKDVVAALSERQKYQVDPFKHGFEHKRNPQSIDLNAVRLCFQVLLPDHEGKFRVPLTPVVSDKVYDKKAMSELTIMRLSACAGPAGGNTELILLCEKVTREDISVVFFEGPESEDGAGGGGGGGGGGWEALATVTLVHRQVAIAFTTPAYHTPDTTKHHQVFIQLRRKSDNERSAPVPFEYYPQRPDNMYLHNKGVKRLAPFLQSSYNSGTLQYPEQKLFKLEPRDPGPVSPRLPPPLEPNVEASPEWLQQVDAIMSSLRRPPAPPAPAPALSPRALARPLAKLSGGKILRQRPSAGGNHHEPPGLAPMNQPVMYPAGMMHPAGAMNHAGAMSHGSMNHAGSMHPAASMNHAGSMHPAGVHAAPPLYPGGYPPAPAQPPALQQLDLALQQLPQHHLPQFPGDVGLHQLTSDAEPTLSGLLDQAAHALLNTDLSLPSLPNSCEFR